MLRNKALKIGLLLWILILACLSVRQGFWIYTFGQEQFVYDDRGKRNPFIPLVTPDGMILNLDKTEEKKQDLAIEGIIYDRYGLSYALVNGEVVKVGDTIGEYQVLKVEKDRVIFIKEGEPLVVKFKEEEP
jgi:hypothetical protein